MLHLPPDGYLQDKQDFNVILNIYPQNSKKILHIMPDLAYPFLF